MKLSMPEVADDGIPGVCESTTDGTGEPAPGLREAAQAVVDAYYAARQRGTGSGFWTHIDDLAKALSAEGVHSDACVGKDQPALASPLTTPAGRCVVCGGSGYLATSMMDEEPCRWCRSPGTELP